MVLFTSSIMNTSGIQIASSLAFACAAIRISRDPTHVPKWVWIAFGLSGAVAILTGPILATMVMMFVFDAVVVAVGYGVGFSVHWAGLAVLAVLLGLLMVTIAAWSIATALLVPAPVH